MVSCFELQFSYYHKWSIMYKIHKSEIFLNGRTHKTDSGNSSFRKMMHFLWIGWLTSLPTLNAKLVPHWAIQIMTPDTLHRVPQSMASFHLTDSITSPSALLGFPSSGQERCNHSSYTQTCFYFCDSSFGMRSLASPAPHTISGPCWAFSLLTALSSSNVTLMEICRIIAGNFCHSH